MLHRKMTNNYCNELKCETCCGNSSHIIHSKGNQTRNSFIRRIQFSLVENKNLYKNVAFS